MEQAPTVTLVFLAYNRRDALRESLQEMLFASGYDRTRVDAIVVDNASTDGTAEMVREEFPQVQLLVKDRNVGVSGWNDGFAAARGDWVLALDDDCYLPPGGLGRALAAAREYHADLVSFRVASTHDPKTLFTEEYRTGLFMYWGCAVLIRRTPVLEELGGYDPEIFVWANELEFMLRFFDRGYRHLHLPDVVAQHMKRPLGRPAYEDIDWTPHRYNARHWGYIVGKHFPARDAAGALLALMASDVRGAIRHHRGALGAVPNTLRGFAHGLRHRETLRNPQLARFYRRNFETFTPPWVVWRPLGELLRSLPREIAGGEFHYQEEQPISSRRQRYYSDRAHLYPDRPAILQFGRDPGRL
jgi:GT2 family glycosyltransferase